MTYNVFGGTLNPTLPTCVAHSLLICEFDISYLCGVVVRASDVQPRGRSACATLGKLFTHMCLCSPSSINWYRHKLGAKQALHATH